MRTELFVLNSALKRSVNTHMIWNEIWLLKYSFKRELIGCLSEIYLVGMMMGFDFDAMNSDQMLFEAIADQFCRTEYGFYSEMLFSYMDHLGSIFKSGKSHEKQKFLNRPFQEQLVWKHLRSNQLLSIQFRNIHSSPSSQYLAWGIGTFSSSIPWNPLQRTSNQREA